MGEKDTKETVTTLINGYLRALKSWKEECGILQEHNKESLKEWQDLRKDKGYIEEKLGKICTFLEQGRGSVLFSADYWNEKIAALHLLDGQVREGRASLEKVKEEYSSLEKRLLDSVDWSNSLSEETKKEFDEVGKKIASDNARVSREIKDLKAKIAKEREERKKIKIPVVEIRCFKLVRYRTPLLEKIMAFICRREAEERKECVEHKFQYRNAADKWQTIAIAETANPEHYANR